MVILHPPLDLTRLDQPGVAGSLLDHGLPAVQANQISRQLADGESMVVKLEPLTEQLSKELLKAGIYLEFVDCLGYE